MGPSVLGPSLPCLAPPTVRQRRLRAMSLRPVDWLREAPYVQLHLLPKALYGCRATHRRLNAATHIMRGRYDGYRNLRHIDAERETGGVDIREAVDNKSGISMSHVEIDVIIAGSLHLGVNRTRDDITGG